MSTVYSSGELLVEALLQELLMEGADDGAWAAACEVAGVPFDEDLENPVESVLTLADAGVLTTDRGLIVTLHDGSEFQVIVKQRRRART